MKTVTVCQPLYLAGWPGYISKSLRADIHVVFDTCQLPDKSFEQRNSVKGNLLTVPCRNKRAPIMDVEIDNNQRWRQKHYRTIEQAYSKSPHWQRCGSWLQDTYKFNWDYLVDLDVHYLLWALDELRAGTKVDRASHMSIDHSLTGPARVIEILKAVEADRFIVGEGARPYTPVEELKSLGIETVFESYPQFTPGVSMLDVLMEYGPRAKEYILGEM